MTPHREEILECSQEDRVLDETTVPTRSERFAAQFRHVNDELIALVEDCTGDDWRRETAEEGWSVGVLAHHIAVSLPAFRKLVEEIADNASLPPRISLERINAGNARHAVEFASVSQDEVLELLRTHGPRVESVLHDLTEAQLAHTTSAFLGNELSLADIVAMIVIGHSRMHLASLRATLAE